SLVIALTITPMLCAYFLDVRQMRRPMPKKYGGLLGPLLTFMVRTHWALDRWLLEPLLIRPTDWLIERATVGYRWVLGRALRHQWWVIPMSLVLAASAFIFAFGLDVPLPGPLARLTTSGALT